ncbi:TGS domain-containing protein, partial [bacterium]|nr:TGS domain-containing protein [bacterium]
MDVTISLPDESQRQVPRGTTALEVAQTIGEGLARAAVAARIDGVLRDLNTPIESNARLEIVTYRNKNGPVVFRHTAAHVLAMAIKRLYPDTTLEDGPATETGFFYDIEMPVAVSPDDFPKIEEEMRKIVKEDLPISRRELSREEAIALFSQRGERFKIETIQLLPEDATISIYEMGDFIDLCRGPHLKSTGAVKSFQIMSVAGA